MADSNSRAHASDIEVMHAAVRALDRKGAALTDWLKRQIDEAFADPRPRVPAREAFKRLRTHHAREVEAKRREKA
jgi:antitoxin ParD1/3/4